MSMSRLLAKIGPLLVVMCIAATLPVTGSAALSDGDGSGSTSPPANTTQPPTTDGNPWHG